MRLKMKRKMEKIEERKKQSDYDIEKCELSLPHEIYDFIFTLNRVSVPTIYPESLKNLFLIFT